MVAIDRGVVGVVIWVKLARKKVTVSLCILISNELEFLLFHILTKFGIVSLISFSCLTVLARTSGKMFKGVVTEDILDLLLY